MSEKLEIQTTKVDQKLTRIHKGLTPEKVAVIRKIVAKNLTDVEVAFFLSYADEMGFNPFSGEIWAYKDKRDNLLVFAGRDGFLSKAQQNPLYKGLRSSAIREEDEFSADIPNGTIHHKITTLDISKRGKILGAYAIAFRKNGEPTVVVVDFQTYNKGQYVWTTHPEDMICKVAEIRALKKAFGISKLQSEFDYTVEDGIAIPINTEITSSHIEMALDKIKGCETVNQLSEYRNDIESYLLNESEVLTAFSSRKKELESSLSTDEELGKKTVPKKRGRPKKSDQENLFNS